MLKKTLDDFPQEKGFCPNTLDAIKGRVRDYREAIAKDLNYKRSENFETTESNHRAIDTCDRALEKLEEL